MAGMFLDLGEHQLNIGAWLLIAAGVLQVVCLPFNITTPYGRYSRSTWGFGINAQLAWFIQESPSFLVPFVLLFTNSRDELTPPTFSPNVVLLCMFLMHYFRRAFVYPCTIKKTAETPILVLVFAIIFCTINGYIQGQYLTRVTHYHTNWFYGPCFIIGSFLFFLGFAINVHSDYILTNLRKPGETGYKIPQGGFFEYVSCANFFGEILEWGGYALACYSFVAFAFFISTIGSIGTRAYHHHRFYKEKFEDYPKHRKAIIPFIF